MVEQSPQGTSAPMVDIWIKTVCDAAGWNLPGRNLQGGYRFRFAQDITVDISALDQREMLMAAEIVPLTGSNRDQILEKTALAVLPRVFKDTGTVATDPEKQRLILQKKVVLGTLRHAQFSRVMETFLNELHFYRALVPHA